MNCTITVVRQLDNFMEEEVIRYTINPAQGKFQLYLKLEQTP